MVERLQAVEIFTPNEFPAWTYVEREQDFERQVLNGLRTPNIIVSTSGPSKSGKSSLLMKVVGKDYLIRIFGPQIRTVEDIWTNTFDWMGAPSASTTQTTTTDTNTTIFGGQGSLTLPGISIGGHADTSDALATANSQATTHNRAGLAQLAREIGNSDFVVFIDDFHYMARALQTEVAKQLKAAAELGIKVCTASVPHRADDVVRANSELRGRVQAVDMEYWLTRELEQIGKEGFPRLNMAVPDTVISRLAVEACGSPQLMQSLCLQLCYQFKVLEALPDPKEFNLDHGEVTRVAEITSSLTDFSTVVEAMHTGPKLRGQDRNQYHFVDDTTGDVYRAVLLALASNPPTMSLSYSDLMGRVAKICVGPSPVGSSVSEACSQIDKIAKKSVETETGVQGLVPIEWDTMADVEILHVAEPYFLFYLRSSSKLKRLGHPFQIPHPANDEGPNSEGE